MNPGRILPERGMPVHNPEKDALQMAANREKLLEAGYRLFNAKTIESVSLEQIARAAGIGVATLYRYFGNKTDLVIAISVWKWNEYLQELKQLPDAGGREHTGAESFAFYLNSFLNLYRDHRDLLRYNQFFNVYIQGAGIDKTRMAPYEQVIGRFADRFRLIWEKGEKDGTLRMEIPWKKAFSATLHVMLAAVTRYAVGLAYQPEEGAGPEEELAMLRDMMLRQYSRVA